MPGGPVLCRVCGTPTDTVLDLGTVPVGSCVLLGDPEQARAYPRGALVLATCPRCGCMQNNAFDESQVDYESGYEESQMTSPTYVRYADELIDRLNSRHRLEAKTVLEAGCGKGEFLVRLCERVGCRGVGIDPAHVPDRTHTTAEVQFFHDRFTSDSYLTGDLILCRHTLEHIGDVAGFLADLVGAAQRTPNASVVVEVPESSRILDEGAFWDVYYEHASYFTLESLATAGHLAGLVPNSIEVTFAGQYLVLDAAPSGDPGGWQPDGVTADLEGAIRRFAEAVPEKISMWHRVLESANKPVLWGASSKAVGFLSALGSTNVEVAVDINPHKQGSYLAGSGVRVSAPDELRLLQPDLVVVMNPMYREEVATSLAAIGIDARVEVCA